CTPQTLKPTPPTIIPQATAQQTAMPASQEKEPSACAPSIQPSQGHGTAVSGLRDSPTESSTVGRNHNSSMEAYPSQPMTPSSAPRDRGEQRSVMAISSAFPTQAVAIVRGTPMS